MECTGTPEHGESFSHEGSVGGSMYLSYFGIRVTNLARSLEFYTKLFGLKEMARGDNTKMGVASSCCSRIQSRDRSSN
jgi:catechol-2,3-dioxygenase